MFEKVSRMREFAINYILLLTIDRSNDRNGYEGTDLPPGWGVAMVRWWFGVGCGCGHVPVHAGRVVEFARGAVFASARLHVEFANFTARAVREHLRGDEGLARERFVARQRWGEGGGGDGFRTEEVLGEGGFVWRARGKERPDFEEE